MIQNLIISLLFLSAIIYLGWLVYGAFRSKSCAAGCGRCGVADVDKLAKEIQSRKKIF